MKMNCLIIIGIILALIGISLILKAIFFISIPILKILLGLFLIYLGLKLIFGINIRCTKITSSGNSTIFNRSFTDTFDASYNERNIVFGEATFDLTNYKLKDNEPSYLRINTIFGSSKILIKKDMPVKIRIDAVFSGVVLPDGNQTILGTNYYKTENADSVTNCLNIDVSTVFGSFKLKIVD